MKMAKRIAALAVFAFAAPAQAGIASHPWGATADDGRKADLFTLTNPAGMEAKITNYGGVIVSLKVPGRDGTMANVVQGFDRLADYTSADYIKTHGHYGAIIGRYANRIRGAKITLAGKTYALDPDGNGDADHGGEMAYFRQVFDASMKDGPELSLVLTRTDPDGFMGFPGTVKVTVIYTLLKSDTLRIDYRATTDKPTVINLTNHSYFALQGEHGPATVDDQVMTLFASHYLPVTTSGGAVPTGEIRSVAGSPFDFTHPSVIGPHLAAPQMGKGLDNTYVIDGPPGILRIAARLDDPHSGRRLEVWTTQPGMQVYSANGVRPKVALARGYVPHGAMSFQTQHYPDSPNHANFPSTELQPGQVFYQVTEFRFSVLPKEAVRVVP
jgi:aldose 1-epimerase